MTMGADSARDDYDASENPPTTDAAFDVAPELVDAVGDDSRRASGDTAL